MGDTIELKDSSNKSASFEISGIVEMYFNHYVFMDRDTFENASFTYKPNCLYLQCDPLSSEEKDDLAKTLLAEENVLSVQFIDDMVENVDDMLSSLNNVVYILIVLAALLSFVVLYNLSNINIHERKREIEPEWEEFKNVLQLNELCAALKWIEENGEDHRLVSVIPA